MVGRALVFVWGDKPMHFFIATFFYLLVEVSMLPCTGFLPPSFLFNIKDAQLSCVFKGKGLKLCHGNQIS